MFGSVGGHLVRTSDGGAQWQQLAAVPDAWCRPLGTSTPRVYVSCPGGAMLRSDDGGQTLAPATSLASYPGGGFLGLETTVAVDRRRPDHLAALVPVTVGPPGCGGDRWIVLVSLDGAQTWTPAPSCYAGFLGFAPDGALLRVNGSEIEALALPSAG